MLMELCKHTKGIAKNEVNVMRCHNENTEYRTYIYQIRLWSISMISENRLKHIIGVARKAYKIAKSEGYEEWFCKKMFMLGYLHDVGYEFVEDKDDHPMMSCELLDLLSYESSKTNMSAIANHGMLSEGNRSDEWRILTMADLQIDSEGNDVGILLRLKDIRDRYGEDSKEYETSCKVAEAVGLLKEVV